MYMQLDPDILLRLGGLMVWQPVLQSVARGFEFQRNCWDFSSWQRIDNVKLVERAMMDYVLMEKSVLGRLVDMHVTMEA